MISPKQVRELKEWCTENDGTVETNPSLTEVTCEFSSDYEYEQDATVEVREGSRPKASAKTAATQHSADDDTDGQRNEATTSTSAAQTTQVQQLDNDRSRGTSIDADSLPENPSIGGSHHASHGKPRERSSKRSFQSLPTIDSAAFEGSNFEIWRDCIGDGWLQSSNKYACKRWFERRSNWHGRRYRHK